MGRTIRTAIPAGPSPAAAFDEQEEAQKGLE